PSGRDDDGPSGEPRQGLTVRACLGRRDNGRQKPIASSRATLPPLLVSTTVTTGGGSPSRAVRPSFPPLLVSATVTGTGDRGWLGRYAWSSTTRPRLTTVRTSCAAGQYGIWRDVGTFQTTRSACLPPSSEPRSPARHITCSA